MEIARKHLLPRVLAQHNLPKDDLDISDDTLRAIMNTIHRKAVFANLRKLSLPWYARPYYGKCVKLIMP